MNKNEMGLIDDDDDWAIRMDGDEGLQADQGSQEEEASSIGTASFHTYHSKESVDAYFNLQSLMDTVATANSQKETLGYFGSKLAFAHAKRAEINKCLDKVAVLTKVHDELLAIPASEALKHHFQENWRSNWYNAAETLKSQLHEQDGIVELANKDFMEQEQKLMQTLKTPSSKQKLSFHEASSSNLPEQEFENLADEKTFSGTEQDMPVIKNLEVLDDDKTPQARGRSDPPGQAAKTTNFSTGKTVSTIPPRRFIQTDPSPGSKTTSSFADALAPRSKNPSDPPLDPSPGRKSNLPPTISPASGSHLNTGQAPSSLSNQKKTKKYQPIRPDLVSRNTRTTTLPDLKTIAPFTNDQKDHEIMKSGTPRELGNFFKVQDFEDFTLGDWDVIATIPVKDLDILLRQLKKVLISKKNPNFPNNIKKLLHTYYQFRGVKFTQNPTDLFRVQLAQFFNVEYPQEMEKCKNKELEEAFAALNNN